MSYTKRLRLRAVMRFARWFGVPIDVNGSYFRNLNKAKSGDDVGI